LTTSRPKARELKKSFGDVIEVPAFIVFDGDLRTGDSRRAARGE